MNFNEFNNLVMERQSSRAFTDKPLEKETLIKILNLSRFCPSACNSQPWKIYCVSSKEKRAEVAKCLQDNGMNPFASDAQTLLVLTENSPVLKERVSSRFSVNHFVKYDIGELIAYITLSAKAEGVDSCILGWLNKENLKKIIGYPDGEDCNIVIALGYSDVPVREKSRKSFDEVVKFI